MLRRKILSKSCGSLVPELRCPVIHLELSSELTVVWCLIVIPRCWSSSVVNLYCIHWQMKSYAAGEILFKIFLRLIKVLSKLLSKPGFDGSI